MFKKDAEKDQAKQAAELERQAGKQAAAEQKRAADAEAAFRATPRGRARTARENGDGFFEYTGSLAETSRTVMGVLGGTSTSSGHKRRMTSHTDVLAQIEDEGWKLEHVGYVFEPTGTVSRDKAFSSGQTSTTSGKIVGVLYTPDLWLLTSPLFVKVGDQHGIASTLSQQLVLYRYAALIVKHVSAIGCLTGSGSILPAGF